MVTKIKIFNMKKTFIAIMAIAAMTACIKDEVVSENREAISFGKAFVDNATKVIDSSYGTGNPLEQFNVYGTVTGTEGAVSIFEGDEVTGSVGNNVWSCDNDQYWVPGAMYNFAALVDVPKDDVAITNGLPSSFDYSVADQKDVLYAVTPAAIEGKASGNAPIDFTFSHLLAKVKFTFTNEYPSNSNFVVRISNVVSVLNAAATGTCTLPATWAPVTYSPLSFGYVVAENAATEQSAGADIVSGMSCSSNYAKLLIPETKEWTIAFKAEVYYQRTLNEVTTDILVDEYDYTSTPLKTGELALEAGKSYNFNITIGGELKPITFSVTTDEWTNEDKEITVQ